MRYVSIDLSSDNHLQQPQIFGGYAGEHNETVLQVALPPRLLVGEYSGYRFDFQTSEDNEISSPLIPVSMLNNGILSFHLTDQLTVAGRLLFNVVATLSNEDAVSLTSKTNMVALYIGDSPEGNAQLVDPNGYKDEILKMIDERIAKINPAGVGKTTAEGGEIFNDYENNKAISPKSHTEGQNNTSGVKGYKMWSITIMNDTNAVIYLDDIVTEKAYNYYAVGDILQFSGTKHYIDTLQITGVSGSSENPNRSTVLEVTPLRGKFVTKSSNNADEIYLAIETSGDTTVENWCYVVGKNYGEVIPRHIGTHTEGDENLAIGWGTTVSGRQNKAIGDYADAGGRQTEAHYVGFTRGRKTKATGDYADATGLNNESSGECAHSSGRDNIASGKDSHVQNSDNVASHDCSDVAGGYNHSSANYQSVVGQACADAPNALFVVGNGDSVRSNALESNRDGTLTIGAEPKKNLDVATKSYVDKQGRHFPFETKDDLINLATKDIPPLNENWGTTSPNIGEKFENINTDIAGTSYITGCKVSTVRYQGFYLKLSLNAHTKYKLKLNLLSTVKLEEISIVNKSAEYDESGKIITKDTDGNTIANLYVATLTGLPKDGMDISNGVNFNIEFTTGDETEYHLYFKMHDYADTSIANNYILINPIYLIDDISKLNVTDLNVGDILLVKENQSSDYWWDGNQIKPIETEKVDLSGYYTREETDIIIGDIETALDGIIAIQESLIGGDSV